VDSGTELGEIPEGWEVKTFNKLFDISYGKTLPMKDFVEDGEYLVYGAGDVVGRYSKKNIDEKHTLITCRGNGSGAVWRTRDEGFVTNNSLILFPKHDYLSYYFNYHLANNSNMKSVITGSAQPQITITNLSFLKSVFAPKEIIDSFNEKVKAIYDQIDLIFESNKKLKETRDLLLPKLISGKIDVGEMELAI
jgi:type I restriction enzyme S subunit